MSLYLFVIRDDYVLGKYNNNFAYTDTHFLLLTNVSSQQYMFYFFYSLVHGNKKFKQYNMYVCRLPPVFSSIRFILWKGHELWLGMDNRKFSRTVNWGKLYTNRKFVGFRFKLHELYFSKVFFLVVGKWHDFFVQHKKGILLQQHCVWVFKTFCLLLKCLNRIPPTGWNSLNSWVGK